MNSDSAIIGKSNGEVLIRDLNTHSCIQMLKNTDEIKSVINTCAIFKSSHGTYVAFSNAKDQVSLWFKQNNEFVRLGNLWTSAYPIISICIGPQSKTLVAGNSSGVIFLWSLEQLEKITTPDASLFKALVPRSFLLPGDGLEYFVLIHNAAFIRKKSGSNTWQQTICFAKANHFDFATLYD